MLEKLFDSSRRGLARVRTPRNGPHGLLLEDFSKELLQSRYANITARVHLRSAEHLIHWASRNHIPLPKWNDGVLVRFDRHLRQRRCAYGHSSARNQLTGACLFLRHLRSSGHINCQLVDRADEPALLVAFRQWMHEQRDTQDATLDNYDRAIRALLTQFGAQPERLDARSLRRCFLKYCDGKSYARVKHAATALRMFVRFLIAEGRCPPGLEAAIPLVPHWRLSSLPRYLQPEEVERTIAACDPSTAVGTRDRVILLLLARLGLRAGDVLQLHLADIDWKHAWVHVCGKGRRPARLPLTQEIGDALVAYLQHGRPRRTVIASSSALVHPSARLLAIARSP